MSSTANRENLQEFGFKLKIKAENQEQALEVIDALGKIYDNLPNHEVIEIATFIEERPKAVAMMRVGMQNPAQFAKDYFLGKFKDVEL